MFNKVQKLPHHAGAAALHEFLDFLLGGHRGVTGRGRGDRAVGCAVVDGGLRVVLRAEAGATRWQTMPLLLHLRSFH